VCGRAPLPTCGPDGLNGGATFSRIAEVFCRTPKSLGEIGVTTDEASICAIPEGLASLRARRGRSCGHPWLRLRGPWKAAGVWDFRDLMREKGLRQDRSGASS